MGWKRLGCLVLMMGVLQGMGGQALAGEEKAGAGDWKITLGGWFAIESKYDEHPGPAGTGKVWGDFDTHYYALKAEKRFAEKLSLDVAYIRGQILENRMYLHSQNTYTEISGYANKYQADVYYRVAGNEGSYADLLGGVYYTSAKKDFKNRTVNGVVVSPGDWGNYAIEYWAPLVGVRGRYLFSPVCGAGGVFTVSPYIGNSTEVTGYGPVQKESASGRGWMGEINLVWLPGGGRFEVLAGYRMENIYFDEPSAASFDLDIDYGGPFVEFSFLF